MDNSVVSPTARRLSDYKPYGFEIRSVDLTFELEPANTRVTSKLKVKKQNLRLNKLYLDGSGLELVSFKINGQVYESYKKTASGLEVVFPFESADVEIVTQFNPEQNKSLEGLYYAASTFCTQCEAEGFRKISYYPDRPDVLSVWSVKIVADKHKYPYLLSNGNKTGEGTLPDGKHWVSWHDPFKKPCYLFALVAGDFDLLSDEYTTQSGRKVNLELYVDKGNAGRGSHALESLKKSMKWDEDTFGLEYDLDIYMIVAVDFFNMGAMENKGLNVFNSKFVLADEESATDEDYFNVESIIAHEYFHNWTGNRVTCRDWFQLSLKEGLTVFRDQQFSSDMSSHISNRIKQVRVMREHQFAEDAGPMSHPIRPEEVIEMNNFYTVTVYDKGAEVIRMIHTLLGAEGFRKGMDLYFKRHDGQAVTCDDFVAAMQDASGVDLEQFRRWYRQSGTPVVTVSKKYNKDTKKLVIKLEQRTPATADQKQKQDLHIPVAWELFDKTENKHSSGVFDLKQQADQLIIDDVQQQQDIVLFTDFSAPVKIEQTTSTESAIEVMLHAHDSFSRWDAAQTVYSDLIWQINDSPDNSCAEVESAINAIVQKLTGANISDRGLLCELLSLPGFDYLSEQRETLDVLALYQAREKVKHFLASALTDFAARVINEVSSSEYRYATEDVAIRRLKNLMLQYHVLATEEFGHAEQQFTNATNMTDSLGALSAMRTEATLPQFERHMVAFEERWRQDVLVLDKWFALHAGTDRDDILATMDLLTSHQRFNFDNPNRVRSVVGTFAFYNIPQFHKADGSGYQYVADNIIRLNSVNPQVAARIVTPMLRWKKLMGERRDKMQNQLLRIADTPDLSKDLFEKVSKSLAE
ncbi:aminopeptidase N [Planctobacterium marinum]|uniref:Aminopeptidase N n=1 Tax=Planctobacterium marinum TaxID=1631968 RepID=A0AA48I5Q4_9ALTE|nr:aminopeptidase N [Planctobacterium marinum]